MATKTYSAGLVSQSFWFVEFKKIIQLTSNGKTTKEIKTACIAENLLGAGNAYRAQRMAGYLTKRVAALDMQEIQLFCQADLATQKIMNLLAVLRNDKLFFEFLYEVYREKIILGVLHLDKHDIAVFFGHKERQSTAIAHWEDSTKKRLSQSYLSFMTDANLLIRADGHYHITPPILNETLQQHLTAKGETAMLKALTGVSK